jgi:hypothetical protein
MAAGLYGPGGHLGESGMRRAEEEVDPSFAPTALIPMVSLRQAEDHRNSLVFHGMDPLLGLVFWGLGPAC